MARKIQKNVAVDSIHIQPDTQTSETVAGKAEQPLFLSEFKKRLPRWVFNSAVKQGFLRQICKELGITDDLGLLTKEAKKFNQNPK